MISLINSAVQSSNRTELGQEQNYSSTISVTASNWNGEELNYTRQELNYTNTELEQICNYTNTELKRNGGILGNKLSENYKACNT